MCHHLFAVWVHCILGVARWTDKKLKQGAFDKPNSQVSNRTWFECNELMHSPLPPTCEPADTTSVSDKLLIQKIRQHMRHVMYVLLRSLDISCDIF